MSFPFSKKMRMGFPTSEKKFSLKENPCLNLSFDVLIQKAKPAEGSPRNVAVSPLSLDAVVAMLGAGCSQPSVQELLEFMKCETVEELKSSFAKALDVVTSSGQGCPNILFVNAAWIDKLYSFQPEYEECLKNTFKIEASNTCDFVNQVDEAVKDINSWAESQTNSLIKSVVKRDQLMRKPNEHPVAVILTNALYFKGFWQDKFDPEWTEKRDFQLINGDRVPDVPFMTSWKKQQYGSFEEYKVLEIPYQQGESKQFCMQIILPHKEDGLKSVLEKLNHNAALNFELERTKLDTLWIPKFKFSTTLEKEDLKIPFLEGDKMLELSKMLQNVEGLPFEVPKIYQKVFIEVDEEGTEAAAVTYAMAAPGYSPPLEIPPPKTFVADHPFLYIVKEKESGLVLFLGTVQNPLENEES